MPAAIVAPPAVPVPSAPGRVTGVTAAPGAVLVGASRPLETSAAVASPTTPPAVPRVPPSELDRLHPALWRGHQMGGQVVVGCPSGFPELDAQLPGGGWPRRVLSELLLGHMGIGELRLLAPALAEVQRAGRLVMLFDPPAVLSGWALAEMGLDVAQLLLIQSAAQVQVDPSAGPARPVAVSARLWALEQALKSGHVGAVLAWLPPRLSPDRVRRLQLAAQAHDGPAFVLRESSAQSQPSAAPLRLSLRPAGVDQLAVNVLKRRGPPLLQPLHLRLPARLPAAVQHRVLPGEHGGEPLGHPARADGRPAHGAAVSPPPVRHALAEATSASGSASGVISGVASGAASGAASGPHAPRPPGPPPGGRADGTPVTADTPVRSGGPGSQGGAAVPALPTATFINLA
jgi:protein ImuA